MAKKPNIVFILSDQQRWDTCGCYGQPLETTPNLDRMAEEGTLFQYAFTPQPVCGPARSCLQTGKYATATGCTTNDIALPTDEKTIATYLTEAGYQVGYIGKWHLASNYATDWFPVPLGTARVDYSQSAIPLERRGGYKDFWIASDLLEYTSHSYDGYLFDADGHKRVFPPGRYRVDAMTDWVLEFFRSQKGDEPFFLFVSYLEPHQQNDTNHFEGPVGSKERFKEFQPPGDLDGADGNWADEYPDYLGCVNSLDHNLGRIRETLDQLGLRDNTLLIYTSDHGCHFRTREGEYKRSCHEASIRVPLVIYGPGFIGGRVVNELVSLMDLPPTVLAAAGFVLPSSMQGRPIQSLVEGRTEGWPEEVFLQISESQCGRAIRTKRWKYSVRDFDKEGWEPASDQYTEEFLYDLAEDPHERKNLVASPDHVAIRAELASALKKRMKDVGEKEPEILPCAPNKLGEGLRVEK